ncbi:MAG: TPM domain-containing protein, partial [Thermoproteota archaeon]
MTTQPAAAQTGGAGSRPGYIYDRAQAMDDGIKILADSYVRRLDDATSAEVVIYTIPSFSGHGIKKDGIEIQDRDMLANYIFNKVSLDGVTGIGKAGKDNGVLVLMSLERDGSGGAMRIEIGRGLEGTITDGLAGEIL